MLNGKDADSNFRLARDSFQLIAYAHRDLSNVRRQRLKEVVPEKYCPLCNDSPPLTENLLGDHLEKQIKTLDEIRKGGKDLTKKKGRRKHTRVGVIKIVIVINYNLITFSKVIACNCN